MLRIRASAVTMGDCEMRSPKIPSLTWFMARLYYFIKLKLIRAIDKGQISPYEFALIDDCQKAVVLRNKLINVENKTGINLYLPD